MTLEQLVNSKNAIQNLVGEKLPIRVSSDLRKLIKVINPILVSYEEARIEKIMEFGECAEGTETWTVKPENIDAFNTQNKEALNEELTLNIPIITVGMLERADVNLSTSDMVMLEWLIKDE